MLSRLFFCCLLAVPAAARAQGPEREEGFTPIFNGKDLTGWEGDQKIWIVEDGNLIGRSSGIDHNEFLATTKTYGDFILRCKVRLVKDEGNSGVQFRSQRVPDSREVSGYQADIAKAYWGSLYDEARRNKIIAQAPPEKMREALKPGEWNDYEVQALGSKITMKINGITTVEYTEQEPDIATTGIIAVQVHAGVVMEVQFKDLRIKELPASK